MHFLNFSFKHLRYFFVAALLLAVASHPWFSPIDFVTQNLLAQAPKADNTTVFPLMSPKLSSKFGMRIHPIRGFSKAHTGVDLAAPQGSYIRALRSGIVIFADNHFGYGKLVSIQHTKSTTSLYAHMKRILVKTGTKVKAGTVIGTVGSTGISTGPHLHLEWRVNGKPLDPVKVLPSLFLKSKG